ncbi:MAG: glycosyltransferase family 9 protein [Desulfomonile sp.]|nr:glycosyltransferase family 9 protein [Desulfomonile sp.]
MDLSAKRVLIVKPSSLGDVVHTLPVVHAIKRCYPSSFVGWIVQEAFAGVLEADPAIDEIIPISIPSTSDPHAGRGAVPKALSATVSTLRQLRRRFRRRPYHVVIDLHASFRSGLLALANPGGTRIGFRDAKELNPLFQHHRLATDPNKPHAVDKNLAFADFLGCPVTAEDFRIVSDPAACARVGRFLGEHGVASGRRIVYANPAARWAAKYWTVEAWAELGDLLIAKARAAVIFAGSAADARYINQIAERMTERPIVAAGKLSLPEAIALISVSDVYVGVDSGPMHIAAFAGTPVVALFGPTEPEKVGPYGEGHKVVQNADLDCLGCRLRACSNRRCLAGITARRVFEETTAVLENLHQSHR